MKKHLFILTIIIFTFTLTGCFFNDDTKLSEKNIILPSKDSITLSDIKEAKENSIPEIYSEMKTKYKLDDKDMAIYYKKVIALNENFNKDMVLKNYEIPYIQALSYCNKDILNDIIKCNKDLHMELLPNKDINSDPKEDSEFILKIYNKSKSYIIEPKAFFIVRDRLTKLPIYAGTKDFKELKSEEGISETKLDLPLSECELIEASTYSIPHKLVFDSFFPLPNITILEEYPNEKLSKEKKVTVQPIITGTVINDKSPKLIKPNGELNKWIDGIEDYSYFSKGTKVIVRYKDGDNYFVSDALGGYTWINSKNLHIDNPDSLSTNSLSILRFPNRSFGGIKLKQFEW